MDADGLGRAYASPSGFYQIGDTVYVAGTRLYGHGLLQALSDVRDDTLLPMTSAVPGGGAGNTRKYRQFEEWMRGRNATTAVGHSLGSAVSKEFARRHGLQWRGYATPAVTWRSDSRSRRHYFDPISILDRGADDSLQSGWNPHAY